MTTATTERVIESFQRHLRAERKSPRTLRAYLYGVEKLFAYLALQGMPRTVEDISREHVESFIGDALERVSPATAHQWYRSCQQFFKWLADDDYIDASPMAHMKPPSLPERLPPVLTEDEVRRLLAVVKGKGYEDRRDNAILRLMLDTGMRLAECAGLTVATVGLDQQIAIVIGKGDRQRACPYGAKTAKAIDRYLLLRDRHPRSEEDALWLGHEGPMTDSGLYQVVRKRGAEAGMTLHPHKFRHAFVDRWLRAGGSEIGIMMLAGWRSRTMVGRYSAANAVGRAIEEHQRLNLMDRL